MDFEYQQDGVIISGNFISIDDFLELEPTFQIPDCDNLLYKKGKLKALIKDGNQYGDNDYNWEALDTYINNAQQYLDAVAQKNIVVETYIQKRLKEYGTPEKQLEYLVENGLDALKTRNLAIKNKYTKA